MAKFKSEQYRELVVCGPAGERVWFANGEAEAVGRAAEAIRAVAGLYGITEDVVPVRARTKPASPVDE